MKKAIIRTYLYEYVDDNNLESVADIFNALPEIYQYLRNHPEQGDLLPKEMRYEDFLHQAERGLKIAKESSIFDDIKRKFFN